VRLTLTERGQTFIVKADETRYAAVAKMLGALPIDKQRGIVEALERASETTRNGNGAQFVK
jgi:hypothetical protein